MVDGRWLIVVITLRAIFTRVSCSGAARHQRTRRKDLQQVDHTTIAYEPFRKNFYNEPPELAAVRVRIFLLIQMTMTLLYSFLLTDVAR